MTTTRIPTLQLLTRFALADDQLGSRITAPQSDQGPRSAAAHPVDQSAACRDQRPEVRRPDDQGLAEAAVRESAEDEERQSGGHDVRQRGCGRGAADPV